jgi:hypothetical protein
METVFMKLLIASIALVSALTMPVMAQNQQVPPSQRPLADPPLVQPQAPQDNPRGNVGQGQRLQQPLSREQQWEKKDLGTDPDPRIRQELPRSNPDR